MLKQFIKTELDKILRTDYYGSKDQIIGEKLILNETNIKMKNQESIEEWYMRVYDSL
tara:strand:+ start:315 stop:485 length:171 start_codon:yes stop_codon:yes gene_type:complete